MFAVIVKLTNAGNNGVFYYLLYDTLHQIMRQFRQREEGIWASLGKKVSFATFDRLEKTFSTMKTRLQPYIK